jgi:hypothetical protein
MTSIAIVTTAVLTMTTFLPPAAAPAADPANAAQKQPRTLGIDTVIKGSLNSPDPTGRNRPGCLSPAHQITLRRHHYYTIALPGCPFEATLTIRDHTGKILQVSNATVKGGTVSVTFSPPANGIYEVEILPADGSATGNYELLVSEHSFAC